MSKKIQLTIPEPCHENWDKMTPAEKGRFCGSCQKQVMDFTRMSDAQVAAFFRKPSAGSVCGRFMQDQLNHGMQIPGKRIPWIKYFFQFALPAFLMSAKAPAQGNVRVLKGDTTIVPQQLQGKVGLVSASICNDELSEIKRTINGKVVDREGAGISYASIFIKGTAIGTMTDSIGNFQLEYNGEKDKIVLVASYIGFQNIEMEIAIKKLRGTKIVLQPAESLLSGEIVVVAGGVVRSEVVSRKKEPVPLITRLLKDTVFNRFEIFPNPVAAGANLNIGIKKKIKEGYYTLDLINQSGQSVYQREIWIDAEARLLNLEIPSVKAGSYFLVIADRNNGKKFTEKLVIQ